MLYYNNCEEKEIMSIIDVKNFLIDAEKNMKNGKWTPNQTISIISSKNDLVYKKFGMMLDNDLYRNGLLNRKQASNINNNLPKNIDWFKSYRPWETTSDLIRSVDVSSVSVAINQMILAINLGNYKETEQMYDMEINGNKYAGLADC